MKPPISNRVTLHLAAAPRPAISHDLLHAVWAASTSSPLVTAIVVVAAIAAGVRAVRALRWTGLARDPVRRFSRADKAATLTRAGHRCEHHSWLLGRCRQTERLEADHVHPHSRGGQTAVTNGQALCRAHNRLKLARVPYNWQLRQLEKRRAAYFPPGMPATVQRSRGRRSRPAA